MRTITLALVLLAAPPALAEETERDLVHPWGMSLSVGGGVTDFTNDDVQGITAMGGYWDARFVFGTREGLGFEAAYVGTARGIDALGMDPDAVLLSTGVEADVRFHILDGDWQPYLLAGLGWRRYDVTNAQTNTSDMHERDDVVEVPLGVGVSWRLEGLVLDARAVYRSAGEEDLLVSHRSGDDSLDNFNVSASVGYEF